MATIVHPSTIRRWIREASGKVAKTRKNVGRPRTAVQIEMLILKLAKDNSWGYTRILGELKKLGIESITRNTVKNILRRNGYETGPNRGPGTWDEFLKRHAKTLWQCDFYSKKVLTPMGMKDLYLLVFLHIGTRRVYVSPSTYQPDAFREHVKSEGLKAGVVMHDRDTKFTKAFDAALKANRSTVRISAFRAPNQNAFVERFIQTLQQECLDHFIVFGQPHMDHFCREFLAHYHEKRPHHGLNNELIQKPKRKRHEKPTNATSAIRLSEVHCRERLGGLLKSYSRKAA